MKKAVFQHTENGRASVVMVFVFLRWNYPDQVQRV